MSDTTIDTRTEYEERYKRYLDRIRALVERKKELDRLYLQHANDVSRPHRTTMADIRMDNLVNAPRMSEAEALAEDGTIGHKYSTPLRVKQTIDAKFSPMLHLHVDDSENPHGLTPALLGSWTAAQILSNADLYYDKGSVVDYTNRLGGSTFEQIQTLARSNLNANEIKTGLIKYSNISDGERPPQTVVKMGPDGKLTWGGFDAGQRDATVYRFAIGPSYGIITANMATIAGWMNANNPATNLIEGSLGAVAITSSGNRSIGYGNGNQINVWNWKNVVLLQVRNRRWVG